MDDPRFLQQQQRQDVPNDYNNGQSIDDVTYNTGSGLPPDGRSDTDVLMNGSGRSETLSLSYVGFAVIATAYLALFLAFLCQVVFPSNFLYGYYRPELKPGPFVDDRYNWIWVFLVLSMIKTAIPFMIFFTFQNPRIYYPREMLYQYILITFWFDFIILIALGVMYCAFCNQCGFRNGVCDAPLEVYCKACWEQQTDVCPPGPSPPLKSNNLPVSSRFWYWLDYTAVWTIGEFLLILGLQGFTKFMKYDYYRSSMYQ